MKVVKNAGYGGFGLSEKAFNRLAEITGKTYSECCDDYGWGDEEIRSAPELIQVVEELGEEVNCRESNLVVVEIPDDVDWEITEYDGWETIEEVHRRW